MPLQPITPESVRIIIDEFALAPVSLYNALRDISCSSAKVIGLAFIRPVIIPKAILRPSVPAMISWIISASSSAYCRNGATDTPSFESQQVIPVQNRARGSTGKLQDIHAE